MSNWQGVRTGGRSRPIELFDLSQDPRSRQTLTLGRRNRIRDVDAGHHIEHTRVLTRIEVAFRQVGAALCFTRRWSDR